VAQMPPSGALALGLAVFLCTVCAGTGHGDNRGRQIRFGGEVMKLSELPGLGGSEHPLVNLMFGLWSAVASMSGVWREEAGKQWYTVLRECADPARIEEATGAALGGLIDGEANAYLLAGTEAMARAVAREECVAWVGARPDAHKIDPTFKGVISKAGGTSRRSGTSDALSLTSIVVLLLPPGQQFPAGRFSAGDFVSVCREEFARRGWAATAENASHTRIQVTPYARRPEPGKLRACVRLPPWIQH